MAFSCKIMLAERAKEDSTRMVYLQCIIDRRRALVPLGFYLKPDQLDVRRQLVKNHANKDDFNKELSVAIAKANTIASKFRMEERMLTPGEFKKEFFDPSSKLDVIKFVRKELALKSDEMATNTHKTHNVLLSKLDAFRKHHKKKLGSFIAFQQLTPDVIQLFKNWMSTEEKNSPSTVNKYLKYLKQYLIIAEKKDIKFKDPFSITKIKTFKATMVSLSQKEVDKLEKYFDSKTCKRNHKQLLRYFLFSCYTGLRISDIKVINWNNINDDVIIIQPQKGHDNNPKTITIPIPSKARKFLPATKKGNYKIFETFAEQTANRMLKKIAAIDSIDIRKKITYHTSRHTYGSLFAEGGNVVALQQIMGHSNIATTMGYVHTNTELLIKATKDRFGD
jgi:integrase/recombinase XerD